MFRAISVGTSAILLFRTLSSASAAAGDPVTGTSRSRNALPAICYSSATGAIWNEEALDVGWKSRKTGEGRPRGRKTKMTFPGFKNDQDRADVIAYLKNPSE